METKTHTIKFRKLPPNSIIRPNDFHSMDDGETLAVIQHNGTVGLRVRDFPPARSFWRPVEGVIC